MLLNQNILSKSLLVALFFIAACSPPSPPAPQADLTVSLTSSTDRVLSASSIDVTGIVSNGGEVAVSSGYDIGVYLSTDTSITSSDIFVGYITGPSNLQANASSTVTGSFSVPASATAGTYNIGLIADAQSVISESNEGNNASTSSVLTYVSCSGASKNVTVSWTANKEVDVNKTGGGYKIYYSPLSGFAVGDGGVTVVDVPYASGASAPTSKVMSLPSCLYYVRVAGYSALGGGSTSDLSTEVSVTVP